MEHASEATEAIQSFLDRAIGRNGGTAAASAQRQDAALQRKLDALTLDADAVADAAAPVEEQVTSEEKTRGRRRYKYTRLGQRQRERQRAVQEKRRSPSATDAAAVEEAADSLLADALAAAQAQAHFEADGQGKQAEGEMAVAVVQFDLELDEDAPSSSSSRKASKANAGDSDGSVASKQAASAPTGPGKVSSRTIAKALEEVMQQARKSFQQQQQSQTSEGADATQAAASSGAAQPLPPAPAAPRVEGLSPERFARLLETYSSGASAPTSTSTSAPATSTSTSTATATPKQQQQQQQHRELLMEQALARERREAALAAMERGEDPALAERLGAEAELFVLGQSTSSSTGPAMEKEASSSSKKPMYWLGSALGGPGAGFGAIGRPDPRWPRGTASWLVLKGRPYEVPPAPAPVAPAPAPESASESTTVAATAEPSEESDATASASPLLNGPDSLIELTPQDLKYVSEVIASKLNSMHASSGAASTQDQQPSPSPSAASRQQHSMQHPGDANLLLSRAMVQNSLPASLQWDDVVRKMDEALHAARSVYADASAPTDKLLPPLPALLPRIDVTKLNADLFDAPAADGVQMDSVKRKRRKKIRKHK